MKTMPASEYHAHPAISKSGLDQIAKSPAHYQAWLTQPDESSPAMQFGSAMHSFILEPDTFSSHYVVIDAGDKRSKAYKDAVAANPTKAVITAEDMKTIEGMAASCRAHPMVSAILKGAHFEQSLFWKDVTGVECKARTDIINIDQGIIADLKTTTSAMVSEFSRDAAKFRYHCQAAMYLNGADKLLSSPASHFVFIAVEKTYPYAVAVYRADSFMIDAGQKAIRKDLDTYAKCLETNSWPGYPEEVQYLSLPAWAL